MPMDAVAGADLVVLALPWGAAQAALRPMAGDGMNPLGMVAGADGRA